MIDGRRVLAIIPARGGSRGVPRKNIRSLGGRPLICHTIDQARAVTGLDAIVVSTEDGEIRSVATATGIDVINRPASLAADDTPTEPVLIHALENRAAAGERFDYVVVLEPTSPFRTTGTITGAVTALIASGRDSLLGVRESRDVVGTIEDNVFRPLVPGEARRRQDRVPKYIEASTIYVCRVAYLMATGTLVSDSWQAYVVPEDEAFDINTVRDFAFAELHINKSGNSDDGNC